LQEDEPSPRHKVDPSVNAVTSTRIPEARAVVEAARILRSGRKVAILAGQGARGAADDS
jgi:thiamine pyrophosphate-dependent acetolactate synthase large subunit-like protein